MNAKFQILNPNSSIPMFTPTRDEARQFFFDVWAKYRGGAPLEGIETLMAQAILLHPEYHDVLNRPDRFLERDYSPEFGDTNPFLHMGLHVALAEQLSIDQPVGIRAQFERLRVKLGDEHTALHAAMECLVETIWQAQRAGAGADPVAYLDCLKRR